MRFSYEESYVVTNNEEWDYISSCDKQLFQSVKDGGIMNCSTRFQFLFSHSDPCGCQQITRFIDQQSFQNRETEKLYAPLVFLFPFFKILPVVSDGNVQSKFLHLIFGVLWVQYPKIVNSTEMIGDLYTCIQYL